METKNINTTITEDDVINNSKLEHLYNHDFGDGRFFQVVFSNEDETHIKLASKTLMKVIYFKDNDNIEGIELIKVIADGEKQKIKFSKFNFQQLKCFLLLIKLIQRNFLHPLKLSFSYF